MLKVLHMLSSGDSADIKSVIKFSYTRRNMSLLIMGARSSGRSAGKRGTNTESLTYPHTKNHTASSRGTVDAMTSISDFSSPPRPIQRHSVALNFTYHRRMDLAHGASFSNFVIKSRTVITDCSI